jgi:hypothetical protein
MNYQEFQELLSTQGQTALAEAEALTPTELTFLQHHQTLSKRYSSSLSRTALEMAILRQKAEKKFPFAHQLYYIKEALEQATSWQIAQHRAKRFQNADWILDVCSSIGSDSLALAEYAPVIAYELDFLRASIAKQNSKLINPIFNVYHINQFINNSLFINNNFKTYLFFDPARRSDSKRKFDVNDYLPPLNSIHAWKNAKGISVKLSPGVDLEQLTDFDAEIEFISLNGELKEAVLWMNEFKQGQKRATILSAGISLIDLPTPALQITPPKNYIYEPDPAIIRSGMVTSLAKDFQNLSQLDPQIAYLTSHEKQTTPLARRWDVEAWMPFNLKKLKAYLLEHKVGNITVKKRGSPITPEALQSKLKLKGPESKTIFLTKHNDQPIAIIAQNIDAQQSDSAHIHS